MKQNMNIVLPMAGKGSRFKKAGYTDSKPFVDVNGKPMVYRAIEHLNFVFDEKFKFILICLREDYVRYDFSKFQDCIGHNKYDIVVLDELTEGAAQTVLKVKEFINNDVPLLIFNSDQLIHYNSLDTYKYMEDFDGGIPCFYGEGTEWSYAKTEDGFVTEVAEKVEISNNATAGYYYWKMGSDFVKYAEQMIEENSRTNGEFYVAPVYNWAIKDGKKIVINIVDKVTQLGTPKYLEEYLNG